MGSGRWIFVGFLLNLVYFQRRFEVGEEEGDNAFVKEERGALGKQNTKFLQTFSTAVRCQKKNQFIATWFLIHLNIFIS